MSAQATYQEEICQIATDVFSSMLKTEVVGPAVGGGVSVPYDVEASVSIEGSWNGLVVIRCLREHAKRWASILMSVEPDESDLADAVGEIINMIGGNIKAILPPRNVLRTPIVRWISGTVTPDLGLDRTGLVVLAASEGMFSVALIQTVESNQPL